MSDEEEFMSEESGSDFSVSEEEYKPNEDSESSDFSGHEDQDVEESMVEAAKQNKNVRKGSKTLKLPLRNRVINKYKSDSMANTSIADVLAKAQFKPKKVLQRSSQTSTDESSPSAIAEKQVAPVFDCNGGLNLSDSDDSDDERVGNIERELVEAKQLETKNKSKKMLSDINKASGNQMDFAKVHDNLKQIEDAKKALMDYTNRPTVQAAQHELVFNIEELLMMGETSEKNLPGPSNKSKSKDSQSSQSKRARAAENESDSDWEEVTDKPQPYVMPKDGIQIEVAIEGGIKRTAKEVDVEACMKRKLNLVRKQHQVCLHKVGLVCWVSHGNYVNKIINSTMLMGMLNKLVPQQWYPKDKTSKEYFEKMAVWYKNIMALKNKEMYSKLKKKPVLIDSLALQVQSKMVICRRDFLLIFVSLLRSMGFQCRMVMSLRVDPIRPPQSELLSLSKKEEKPKAPPTKVASNSRHSTAKPSTSKSKSSSSNKSSSSSSKKSSSEAPSKTSSSKSSNSSKDQPTPFTPAKTRSRGKEIKIPQMDGLDDEPASHKTKKPMKIKLKSFPVIDESFVNMAPQAEKPAKLEKSKKPTKSQATVKSEKKPEKGEILKMSSKAPEARSLIAGSKAINSNSPTSSRDSRDLTKRRVSFHSPISSVQTLQKSSPQLKKLKVMVKKAVVEKTPTKEQPIKSEPRNKSKQIATEPEKISSKPFKESVVKSRFFLEAEPSPRRLRNRSTSDQKDEEPSTSKNVARPSSRNLKRPIISATEKNSKKPKLLVTPAKPTGTKKKARPVDSDSDEFLGFDPSSAKKVRPSTSISPVKKTPLISRNRDKRVLSTDVEDVEDSPSKAKNGIDIWCEVYAEKEKKWFCLDIFKGKIDCATAVYKAANHPVAYVLAWNNDNTVKDVSARYCPQFTTATRKLRVEKEYFDSIMEKFKGPTTQRDIKEDREMQQMHLDKPLPTSIGEFKNHPLYALKRHLLKFEGIYPPEAATVGFIREEAIYPRDCVFTMHSREVWVKQARVVKMHELPYKIVTARPKWDRATNKCIKDIPLELFGIWQTKEYEPPTAENGVVPRNMYGNVELFKACMLPKKTVHLQLPGLNKVCKKLGVDCAQAVVGFDFNGGFSHPVFDGFVVCEEFLEQVQDAWCREQEEVERKAEEKFEARVYGNWKKLIKGLFIRERLKRKYNFEVDKE